MSHYIEEPLCPNAVLECISVPGKQNGIYEGDFQFISPQTLLFTNPQENSVLEVWTGYLSNILSHITVKAPYTRFFFYLCEMGGGGNSQKARCLSHTRSCGRAH